MEKQRLREAIDLRRQVEGDTSIKRVATTNGGEYAGPCPFCPDGGRDRFRVWPEHSCGFARFWCRQCSKGGDAIQYVMDRDGLSFKQVVAEYGNGNGGHHHATRRPTPPRVTRVEPPVADWQNNAMLLVADCETALWEDQGAKARAWLRDDRGLSDDTIRAWRLGLCPDDGERHGLYCDRGIVIPWFDAQGRLWKVNVRRPVAKKVKPKYRAVGGSVARAALYGVDHLRGRADCLVLTGEFDAILMWQEVGDLVDVLTLGGDSGRLDDRWLAALLQFRRFWIAADADDSGEKAADYWLDLVGERGKRIYPPAGEKDVTDSWKAGADLRSWTVAHVGAYDEAENLEQRFEALERDAAALEAELDATGARLADLEDEGELVYLADLREHLAANGLRLVSVDWPNAAATPLAAVTAARTTAPT